MEQNRYQLLDSAGTINLPVRLLQSSIIRPSSPIQMLEAYSPSSRINISTSKLKLNAEELNFYQLVKDYIHHKNSQSTKLSQLIPQGSSKLVASKAFYNILVLKEKGLIKLGQPYPYDEIDVIPV
jgi:chromatin segregation and condensation protein Rec8/ScpA/Scc1 (kleisin family)